MKTLEIYRDSDGVLTMAATFDYQWTDTMKGWTGKGWMRDDLFPYFLYGYSGGRVDARPESRLQYCGWCGGKFRAGDLYAHLQECGFVLRDLLDDDRERYGKEE